MKLIEIISSALNLVVIHYLLLNHCSPLGLSNNTYKKKYCKKTHKRRFSNCVELNLRWKRVGRNGDESNTGKREKMDKARTSAEPVRLSATSNLHVPSLMPEKEKERDRRMGEGPRRWIEKRWARQGRQVQFLTVSHWSPVPSSMPGMVREKERRVKSRENKKYNRKLAFLRRVVAKERKKIQKQK